VGKVYENKRDWRPPSWVPPVREGNQAARPPVPPVRRGNRKEGVLTYPCFYELWLGDWHY